MATRARALAGALVLSLMASAADAAPRSHTAIAAFKREYHCPATDLPRGACPGYTIDHIIPLCAGGPDDPGNMQWQTDADALAKDKEEAKLCRALRRQPISEH